MIGINQGTVKAVIFVSAILIFAAILLALKLARGKSVRAILKENQRLFIISYGFALLVLIGIFLLFFFLNNRS